jgi:hypothetical protein
MYNWPFNFQHTLRIVLSLCSSIYLVSLSEMNNFRFEEFVGWEMLDLNCFQESTLQKVPTLIAEGMDPREAHLTALFGHDHESYLTVTERAMLSGLSVDKDFQVSGKKHLQKGTLPHCTFNFWIALPDTRLANLVSTGKFQLKDFPFLGEASDGLKMNFSFNARSALLFATFAQSKSHMDFPMSDEKYDSEAGVTLLTFTLSAKKLVKGLSNGTFTLWNRKYLDYFLSIEDTLQLDALECDSMQSITFEDKDCNTWTFGKLVTLMNDELDSWKTFDGSRCFHWRHFHLPLMHIGIMSQLCNLDDWELEAPADMIQTLTKSLSELSFTSFDVIEETGKVELSEDEAIDFVYVTDFGARHHLSNTCVGLNKRPTRKVTLCSEKRPLCQICKGAKGSSSS